MARQANKRHLASLIVGLHDGTLEHEDDDTPENNPFDFWYYCPAASRISIPATAIAAGQHYFESPTNSWSIFVEYSDNDRGAACFYTGQYKEAVEAYVRYRDSNISTNDNAGNGGNGNDSDDSDLGEDDCDYNVFEALERWSMSKPGDIDLQFKVLRMYKAACPDGKLGDDFWFFKESEKLRAVEKQRRAEAEASAAVARETLPDLPSPPSPQQGVDAPPALVPPMVPSNMNANTNADVKAPDESVVDDKARRAHLERRLEDALFELSIAEKQEKRTQDERDNNHIQDAQFARSSGGGGIAGETGAVLADFPASGPLGITLCSPTEHGPAMLEGVKPDVAARHPGLMPGLVIREVNAESVPGFAAALRAIRAAKKAGKVEVLFTRPATSEADMVRKFMAIRKENAANRAAAAIKAAAAEMSKDRSPLAMKASTSSTAAGIASTQALAAAKEAAAKSDRAKEIRFLQKKLREITAIEGKCESDLNDDQRAKRSRKKLYAQRLKQIQ